MLASFAEAAAANGSSGGATATVAATSGWFLVRKFVVDSDGNGNGSIGFVEACVVVTTCGRRVGGGRLH